MPSHSIDEALIERFIASPETLSEQAREQVCLGLQTDPYAREVACFYASFYAILRGISGGGEDASDSVSER